MTERIGRTYPHLILQQASGGGTRLDLATVAVWDEHFSSDENRYPHVYRMASGMSVFLPPETAERFQSALRAEVERQVQRGDQALLLVASPIRLVFKRFTETTLSGLTVLAFSEVPVGTEVNAVGMVSPND